jgi:hypothetical protein
VPNRIRQVGTLTQNKYVSITIPFAIISRGSSIVKVMIKSQNPFPVIKIKLSKLESELYHLVMLQALPCIILDTVKRTSMEHAQITALRHVKCDDPLL